MSDDETAKLIADAIRPLEARVAELERQVLLLRNPQQERDARVRLAQQEARERRPGGVQKQV